jgi:peptidoglycan hydrolase-like protein with peptidoglycan-binding domain
MTLTGDEPDLELGASGEFVVLMQVRLYSVQLFNEIPDGTYGSTTENAVRLLQSQVGHDNTGMVTRDTWEALLYVEQQYSIHYQFNSPYDAVDQLLYDLQHPEQPSGSFPFLQAQPGQVSADGQWQWDGSTWQAAQGGDGHAGQLSEDGQWRWDGSTWQAAQDGDARAGQNEHAGQLSEDGQWRWDGSTWQAAGGSGATAGGSAGGDGHVGQLSEDGQWRWDGAQWQAA